MKFMPIKSTFSPTNQIVGAFPHSFSCFRFVMDQLDQQTHNERTLEDKSRKEILSTIGGDRHAGISLSGKSDPSK